MTETLANGYSSESTQWELSYKYPQDLVLMMFMIICALDESNLSSKRVNHNNTTIGQCWWTYKVFSFLQVKKLSYGNWYVVTNPCSIHLRSMLFSFLQVKKPCSCKASSSSLIGGSGAGWEGTALLHHGSYIKVGCIQFVFSIVENAMYDPDRRKDIPSILKTSLRTATPWSAPHFRKFITRSRAFVFTLHCM